MVVQVGWNRGIPNTKGMGVGRIPRWNVTNRGLLGVLWIAGANVGVQVDGSVIEMARRQGSQALRRRVIGLCTASDHLGEAQYGRDGAQRRKQQRFAHDSSLVKMG
jgi:hypothetical protein